MNKKLRKMVCELGKNIPPTETAAQILRLAQDPYWNDDTLAKLHYQIQLEKVVLQAYHNACLLNQQQELRPLQYVIQALQEENDQRIAFTENVMPAARAEVGHILEQAGVNYLFIKGSSLESYPHGYRRQMNDLDIAVESWNDLFHAAQALEAQGYHHTEPNLQNSWIIRLFSSGNLDEQMAGHLLLTHYQGDDLIKLDMRSCPLSIGTTGILICNMWARARERQMTTPTPEDRLLILVAHAANHGYFLIKDFNDVYALLHRQEDAFDWDYFCRCIQSSALSYAAYYVLNQVCTEYDRKWVPKQVLDTLRQDREMFCGAAIAFTSGNTKEPRWRRWAERITYTFHTLAFERAHYGLASGLKRMLEYVGWAFRFPILQGSIGDIAIVKRLLHSHKGPLFPHPRRGQQIIILPAEQICDNADQERMELCWNTAHTALQDNGTWLGNDSLKVEAVGDSTLFLQLGSAEAILTSVDLFIPTEDGIFTEPEVEDLEELVQVLLNACET